MIEIFSKVMVVISYINLALFIFSYFSDSLSKQEKYKHHEKLAFLFTGKNIALWTELNKFVVGSILLFLILCDPITVFGVCLIAFAIVNILK